MTKEERQIATKRNEAILWAREVLEHKDQYVIFDTETTGLKERDVIVHFAVMDLDGNMLIDTKVKPMSKRRMSPDAHYIHGMTMKDLKDAPLFEEVVEMFKPIAATKKLISYNVLFHGEMFVQTYENEGLSGEPMKLDCWDAKDKYQAFLGQYGVALPGRKNTGVGDCMATLAVIQKMAAGEIVEIKPINQPIGMSGVWLLLAALLVFFLLFSFC